MFWGRTGRQALDSAQTDFGHNIKSYAMIHNANQVFPDRPWDDLAADRSTLLGRAWDPTADRWNEDLTSFEPADVVPDSGWWIHDEADQLLAALDLTDGFAHADQLARSSQKFLDVYVDRAPEFPVRETFTRVLRTGEVSDERASRSSARTCCTTSSTRWCCTSTGSRWPASRRGSTTPCPRTRHSRRWRSRTGSTPPASSAPTSARRRCCRATSW